MPLIDIVSASTDFDLTTTEAVKRSLGTTSTANDAYLSAMIRVASRWAESIVGYPLSAQSYREIVPGYGTRSLTLARMPIRAVQALYDTTSTDSAGRVGTSEMQVQHGAGLIRRPTGWQWTAPSEMWLNPRPLPGQEVPTWLAYYVAGYTYAGIDPSSPNYSTEAGTTSTGRSLPEDIEQAVILRAQGLFDGSDQVVEEAVGDLRLRYAGYGQTGAQARSDPATMLLLPYARII